MNFVNFAWDFFYVQKHVKVCIYIFLKKNIYLTRGELRVKYLASSKLDGYRFEINPKEWWIKFKYYQTQFYKNIYKFIMTTHGDLIYIYILFINR